MSSYPPEASSLSLGDYLQSTNGSGAFRSRRAERLWSRVQIRIIVLLHAAATALLYTSWWKVSATADPTEQVFWLVTALAALMLAGVGAMYSLIGARRTILGRLDGCVRALAGGFGRLPAAAAPASRSGALPHDDVRRPAEEHPLVSGRGMLHYHRPGCMLVADKPVQAMKVASHSRAGRRPCGMCQP